MRHVEIHIFKGVNQIIGLMFLAIFVVYLLLSFLVIGFTVLWAKKRGRNAWNWGFIAAFMMYNLMFWDWIPAMVLHNKYCDNEASRSVYVSPENWLEQEALDGSKLSLSKAERKSSISNNAYIFPMNSRINYVISKEARWPNILRFEGKYIDVKTNKVLAESVDFEAGGCSRNDSIMDYRFWISRCGCKVPTKSTHEEFKNLESAFQKMGRSTNVN